MIDGEGYISKHTNKELWTVGICNTSIDLMHWLTQYGGNLSLRKFGPKSFSAQKEKGIMSVKDQWIWKVSTILDVHDLLISVEPFMVIKKSKAQEVIKRIELKPNFVRHL